jgi:hypothetical protein
MALFTRPLCRVQLALAGGGTRTDAVGGAGDSIGSGAGQPIVLLEVADRALSVPSLVYDVTAKYQVPLVRPLTT